MPAEQKNDYYNTQLLLFLSSTNFNHFSICRSFTCYYFPYIYKIDRETETEMKVKSDETITTLIARKQGNKSFLSKETYDMLIHQINILNQWKQWKTAKD